MFLFPGLFSCILASPLNTLLILVEMLFFDGTEPFYSWYIDFSTS
jgi:hypothetical protein